MTDILLVDDHPFFLYGLSQFLAGRGDYKIETASSVEQAIEMIDDTPPDIALLDITMHNGGGMAVLRHIRSRQLDIRVMFVTVHIDPEQTLEAIKLGIEGILLKDSDPETIVEALQAVLDGKTWFENSVTQKALQHSVEAQSSPIRSFDLLTAREQEIADLVCQGLKNRDIAMRCDLAEGTVKIHVHSIFRKLGVNSRAELIVSHGGMSKRRAS